MQGKKAILVVSFGTSHADTRNKTIHQIEKDIREEFTQYQIYTAFTSKTIIHLIEKQEHIHICTVIEAANQMLQDGIEEVIVQPTHIIDGIENDTMKTDMMTFHDQFKSIRFGKPLLGDTTDYMKTIHTLAKQFPTNEENCAVILMGHGTNHKANNSYSILSELLGKEGYDNVYVATVEASPNIQDVIKELSSHQYQKIKLLPFMVVAGEHAKNDMAGSEESSWKNLLKKEGYETSSILKGLGEYTAIRNQYLEHIKSASTLSS